MHKHGHEGDAEPDQGEPGDDLHEIVHSLADAVDDLGAFLVQLQRHPTPGNFEKARKIHAAIADGVDALHDGLGGHEDE